MDPQDSCKQLETLQNKETLQNNLQNEGNTVKVYAPDIYIPKEASYDTLQDQLHKTSKLNSTTRKPKRENWKDTNTVYNKSQ